MVPLIRSSTRSGVHGFMVDDNALMVNHHEITRVPDHQFFTTGSASSIPSVGSQFWGVHRQLQSILDEAQPMEGLPAVGNLHDPLQSGALYHQISSVTARKATAWQPCPKAATSP